VLLVALAPLLRRDRLARFWGLGMLLAMVPVAATFPMDRLLTFAGLGASGLLAQFLASVLGGGEASRKPAPRPVVALAWGLVAVHLVVAPLALPIRAANPAGPRWIERRLYVRTPLGRSLDDRTVVVVNAPSPIHASYLVLLREQAGQTGPERVRALAPGLSPVTVRRLDERTLSIRPRAGYLAFPLDAIFRSERRALARGERVQVAGMIATITALTPDGRPAEVAFRFDDPLESPRFLWLAFRGRDFEPFVPPAVGQEVELAIDAREFLSPGPMKASAAAGGMQGPS
jgi:hypothetical protein